MKANRAFAAGLVLSLFVFCVAAAPSANIVLEEAQATAKTGGKNVFLLFDAPG